MYINLPGFITKYIFFRTPDVTQSFRILSFVPYKYEIWCRTPREANKLHEFPNQLFGKIECARKVAVHLSYGT
jgi:hypothetical protein